MAKAKELSDAEINQRVAVLKRFRELLKAQRERFNAYLEALDKSKEVIEHGTADELIRHVDLEEKIITDIHSIQKVIEPLEKMYQDTRPAAGASVPGTQSEAEVPSLKSALLALRTEAVSRSERNRKLLSNRMTELRSEIKSLRSNPYSQKRSSVSAPSLVDIRG